MMPFALPSLQLLREQADWLSPARSRLLRQVGIAHRKRILDLGCGYGIVTEELARRGGDLVVGVDREVRALKRIVFSRFETTIEIFTRVSGVCGEAEKLPFADHAFDLVFCQLALMWMPLEKTVQEIGRVAMKEGVVVAIEPDYGGMLEWPEGAGLKEVWISALERAGADPLVGRKMPGMLSRAGFEVRVETTSGIQPPAQTRFDILRGLPLTPEEQRKIEEIEKRSEVDFSGWEALVHLPFVLVIGTKSRISQ